MKNGKLLFNYPQQTVVRTLTVLLALIVSALLYNELVYATPRQESLALFTLYGWLFVCYLLIYWQCRTSKQVLGALTGALLLRFGLLPAFPNLSDDVYRFIWDGRLLLQGVNPFAELPVDILSQNLKGLNQQLFDQLNSPEYFTIYPPLAQAVFTLSVWPFPSDIEKSILLMRLFVILAEAGSLWLLFKLLRHYRLPVQNILLYALNPLVILELSGNLHFEVFVVFFLLLAIYWLEIKKWQNAAAIAFGLAICSKLLPLIFLPLLLFRLPWRSLIRFYTLTAVVCVLMFAPLLSRELLEGMSSSLSLYFQRFEFNASIYYLVREIGYGLKGYNIIASSGKLMALCSFAAIMIFTFWEKERKLPLPAAMMWVLGIYLLFTTTLHPWYIVPMIGLSVLTKYRFTVLWSLMIFFTYRTYHYEDYQENLLIVFFEYVSVAAFLIYEWKTYGAARSVSR